MMDYNKEWDKLVEARETFLHNSAIRHEELANAIASLHATLNHVDESPSEVEGVSNGAYEASQIDEVLARTGAELDALLASL